MMANAFSLRPTLARYNGSLSLRDKGTGNPSARRIIEHLKLKFVAEKPPPPCVFEQVALMAAEERAEYS